MPLSSFVCAAAVAQNLDPTVVVSRDYEGKLMEVHKPKIEMAVPDSVLRFDLEFDYSVSDSPYKGAYDFTPYVLDMKPSPTYRHNSRLYLNAGAGYQFHPELDLVWSPALKSEAFKMNVFAHHRSYIGKWWNIAAADTDAGIVFDRVGKDALERDWSGKDLVSNAGFNGKYDWEGGALRFDAGYYGIYQNDRKEAGRSLNALDLSLDLASKAKAGSQFGYKAGVAYRYGSDAYDSPVSGSLALSENLLDIDASIYTSFRRHRLGLDVEYGMAGYTGFLTSNAALLSLSPHYMMKYGRFDIDLGLTLSKVFRGAEMQGMFQDKIQSLYPDVKVGFRALPSTYMYVEFGGGARMNTYSSLLQSDRRIGILYGRERYPLLDMTDERISAVVGVDGNIRSRFSYSLKGGFANYGNAPLDALSAGYAAGGTAWYPALFYGRYGKAFIRLQWMLDAERIDFGGSLQYAKYRNRTDAPDQLAVFMPASMTGDLSVRYNWKSRLYAGLECEFASARQGKFGSAQSEEVMTYTASRIPGYADLGLELEYILNRKFSLWVKGGNLLNMTIQRSLMYAEKGPYFTLGFCLNL